MEIPDDPHARPDPLLALQHCLTWADLAFVLEALHFHLHCPMALYCVDSGWVQMLEVRPGDLHPQGNPSAHLSARQAPAAPRCPQVFRFSDDPDEAWRLGSGFYHRDLQLAPGLFGALITAHCGPELVAWILCYRPAEAGDFTPEEMQFLARVQAHFERAVARLRRLAAMEAMAASGEIKGKSLMAPRKDADLSEPLTGREQEVLLLVVQGCTNREIAARLFLSIHTVRSHRASIPRKLKCQRRSDLIRYAQAQGWIPF